MIVEPLEPPELDAEWTRQVLTADIERMTVNGKLRVDLRGPRIDWDGVKSKARQRARLEINQMRLWNPLTDEQRLFWGKFDIDRALALQPEIVTQNTQDDGSFQFDFRCMNRQTKH